MRSLVKRGGAIAVAAVTTSTLFAQAAAAGTIQDARILEAVEDLRIDGYEADLMPTSQAVVWPGGRFAVVQVLGRSLRLFDATGRSLGSVGREGDGPGEFRMTSFVGRIADTLWVYDGRSDRFTLFAPDLSLVRSFVSAQEASPAPADVGHIPAFGTVYPRTLLPGGWMLAFLSTPKTPGDPYYANPLGTSSYRVRAAEGTIGDLVAKYDEERGRSGEDRGYMDLPNGGNLFAPFPFLDRQYYAVSDDGAWIAIATDVANGPNDRGYGVTLLRSNGDTTYTRVYPVRPIAITQESRDSVLDLRTASLTEAVLSRFSGPQKRSLTRTWRRRAEESMPETYPALERRLWTVSVGDDGAVWLMLKGTSATQRRYAVIDSTGNLVGETLLPANVTLLSVTRDRAWGAEKDEYDVPSIVRYRLRVR